MRVSEQFTKFWAAALTVALAGFGFQTTANGQIVQAAQASSPVASRQVSSTVEKVSDWLSQARTAMARGDAKLADHYIQIAEELQSQQPAGQPLAYTPAMARQELALIAGPATSQPANQMQQSGSDIQTQARGMMLKARRALASGDVETAKQLSAAATQSGANFTAIGDSPRQLDLMIYHHGNLAELAKARAPSYNEQAAKFLVQQARSLMTYQDFDTAKTLAEQAGRFPVQPNVDIGNPQQLLTQIAALQDTSSPTTSNVPSMTESPKSQVMKLVAQAQLAFDQKEFQTAKQLIEKAKQLNVPDSAFAQNEVRPWQLELKLQQAASVTQPETGSFVIPAAFADDGNNRVVQADYIPESDQTRNVQVSGMEANPAQTSDDRLAKNVPDFNPIPSRGMQLYRAGLTAMDENNPKRAQEYFKMAWNYQDTLDSGTRQAIQDKLSTLSSPAAAPPGTQPLGTVPINGTVPQEPLPSGGALNLNNMESTQRAIFRRMQNEVFKDRAAADRMRDKDPRKALEMMTMLRSRVAQSELTTAARRPLLTIIDRDINEFQAYIEKNLPEIMNKESNMAAMESVENRRQRKVDVEMQLQRLVDDFNRLMSEQRWAEADMIARQARELDPDHEIVELLTQKALFAVREMQNEEFAASKERNQFNGFRSTELASNPNVNTESPYVFGPADQWGKMSQTRSDSLGDGRYDSEAEARIWNLLKSEKVQGEYKGTLAEAVNQLSRQAGVNIIFDTNALEAETISADRMIDVPIHNPIMLQSALNLILETNGLVFIVEDEVIKVTSKAASRKDLKRRHFYVGDLVTPIKNFTNTNYGYMHMNWLQPNQPNQNNMYNGSNGVPLTAQTGNQMQAQNGLQMAAMSNSVMGQQIPNMPMQNGMMGGYGGNGPQMGTPTMANVGPQQLGGVTIQDFQPLVDLIKSTIAPDDWDDTNGDGTIQPYVANLSLIVSQTQEVQDQIQDLLDRLRELNDVQIVVEVRFITLQDTFFERIGVDFDFQINDNSGLNANTPIPDEVNPSTIIGLDALGNPTGDGDLALLQNTFAAAVPQFGGFDPATASSFGFAILSDIEVFFLIQAAKGDTRSNIMQAPTVTMFNGQTASVNDGNTRPFVTSVTPVVGDFAVAHQPIITLLPEGTSLNVQAVVSSDRRFVRLTLVPSFTQIVDVEEFTFDGRTTTRRSSSTLLDDILDGIDGNTDNSNDNANFDFEEEREGVTIQLPVIAQTQVNSVVSVPDGGTALLGGIKRMQEGRTERGVPFLSNIPYINRLFKNVGIGRETQNLMMMVTPRIIIQKEEEENQVGNIGG